MTCTCGNAVPDLTAHLGFCSDGCLQAEAFWIQIREPLTRLLRDADNPMPCRRCEDGTVRTCAACLAEIAATDPDRDASAAATLMHMRGGIDPTTGRTDPGRWGW